MRCRLIGHKFKNRDDGIFCERCGSFKNILINSTNASQDVPQDSTGHVSIIPFKTKADKVKLEVKERFGGGGFKSKGGGPSPKELNA